MTDGQVDNQVRQDAHVKRHDETYLLDQLHPLNRKPFKQLDAFRDRQLIRFFWLLILIAFLNVGLEI